MKKLVLVLIVFLAACTTAEIVNTWKNPDIVLFDAYKVLIVGMTPDQKSQEEFETKMTRQFKERGVEAMRSIDVFDVTFTNAARSEAELDDVEQQLLDKDFDAVLFTRVLGAESRQSFSQKLADMDRYNARFKDDYLSHQDIYYNDEYYEEYTVYLVETSLYCICVGKERDLIWRAVLEIENPFEVHKTINEFVELVVMGLTEEDLIFRKEKKNAASDM